MRLGPILLAALAVPYAWSQTDGITVSVSRAASPRGDLQTTFTVTTRFAAR